MNQKLLYFAFSSFSKDPLICKQKSIVNIILYITVKKVQCSAVKLSRKADRCATRKEIKITLY